MKKTKPIRDPVHNYISLTPIEREIIDTPDFQRLRYVLQNSTAQLTYPNANNCRFLHSLGTMHLSGRIFLHSLKNSHAPILAEFLCGLENVIKQAEQNIRLDHKIFYESWQDTIGNASRFFHAPKIGDPVEFIAPTKSKDKYTIRYKVKADNKLVTVDKEVNHDPLFLINTIWQVVRVAGLVHDIGHLPMSHVFEFALDKFLDRMKSENSDLLNDELKERFQTYTNLLNDTIQNEIREKQPPIHEMRGLYIFGDMNPSSNIPYYGLIFSLASTVLAHNTRMNARAADKETHIIRCLHRVIDGEVDSDRLDYCIRDSYASGVEFGALDLERIIVNMILCKAEESKFLIVPEDTAISAIETFYHHRYLLYKYEIYHHNVVRFDGLLEQILIMLFEEGYSSSPNFNKLKELFNKSNFIVENNDGSLTYMPDKHSSLYDDGWLRSILSEILTTIIDSERQDKWIVKLRIMLETYLFRKTNNLLSLWKKDSDILRIFSEHVCDPDKLAEIAPFTLDGAPLKKTELYNAFIKRLSTELGEDKIVIERRLKPKIHVEDNLSSSIYCNNSIEKAEKISPYISSLNLSIITVPDVHISVMCGDIKNSQDLKNQVMGIFNGCLEEYISQLKVFYDEYFSNI